MKKILITSILLMLSTIGWSQAITDGTWFNEEKTARVAFYESKGKLYGKIVWLKDPNENGKPRTDINNPIETLRSKPLMGLVFLKGFEKEGANKWEDGEIYDPKNGKTYSCYITEISTTKLEARGYIGISLLGRTTTFSRATK